MTTRIIVTVAGPPKHYKTTILVALADVLKKHDIEVEFEGEDAKEDLVQYSNTLTERLTRIGKGKSIKVVLTSKITKEY